MISSMQGSTTVSNIGVAMFTVADQDAALAFYTEKLGWEVRGDDRFGETADMKAEYERLSATDGVTITTEPMDMGGAPPMFSIADPDGNNIWIVHTPPAS